MSRDHIRFYGLLYIDRERNRDVNIRQWHPDPVEIYICCAALAAKSAKANGVDFALLTNDASEIRRVLDRNGLDHPALEEIGFDLNVPIVKEFYSAHFKIDAIKALASGTYGEYVGLVDVDTLFLSGIPDELLDAARTGFCVYETSDVFWMYGEKSVRKNLNAVIGTEFENARWYGGEFLVASVANMRILHEEVEKCWPRYVARIKTMRHTGDEMPVSAALNILRRRGMPLIDLGRSRGKVGRWWASCTKYPQTSFDEMLNCFLLHLPSDKIFLADQAKHEFRHEFALGSFVANYKAYAKRKITRLRWKRPLAVLQYWPSVARQGVS